MIITPNYIAKKLQLAAQKSIGVEAYSEMAVNPAVRLRGAAVLIPLAFFQDEWHILYTRRTDKVESHKGQVSFPGGASDAGETTPEQTALREADEELGINPKDVTALGRLSRMITISNFVVSPVVGIIPFPYAFKVAGVEVARVFTIPLLWLADRSHYSEFTFHESEKSLIAYQPFDGELLWGATARMTVSFLKALEVLK